MALSRFGLCLGSVLNAFRHQGQEDTYRIPGLRSVRHNAVLNAFRHQGQEDLDDAIFRFAARLMCAQRLSASRPGGPVAMVGHLVQIHDVLNAFRHQGQEDPGLATAWNQTTFPPDPQAPPPPTAPDPTSA